MKTIALFAMVAVPLWATPPAATLTWQEVLDAARSTYGEETPLLRKYEDGNANVGSLLSFGGITGFGYAAVAASHPRAMIAKELLTITGLAVPVGWGISAWESKRMSARPLPTSTAYRQIVEKIGKAKAEELHASFRSGEGLHRVLRDFTDSEQSAPFSAKFREERARLAQIIKEGSLLPTRDRNQFIDLVAADHARLLLETKEAGEARKVIDANEEKIREAMKKWESQQATPPRIPSVSTH